MLRKDYCTQILLENALDYREKNMVIALEADEKSAVDSVMLGNLFKSTIEKRYIDFDDIPNSKGDIETYKEYDNLISVIEIIKKISGDNKIPEITIVDTALGNLRAYKEVFKNAYKLEKEILILQYNLLVAACIESTSLIIASYMEFIRTMDATEFKIIRNAKKQSCICLDALEKFNMSVKQGEFSKFANTIITKESFVGIETVALGAIFLGAALSIVPIIRELTFYFYNSRMQLSDYLKQQAIFLELNKSVVNSNKAFTPNEKKAILKKQEGIAKKLSQISDKIKVNHTISNNKTMKEVKSEEKAWSLDNIKAQVATSASNGLSLL